MNPYDFIQDTGNTRLFAQLAVLNKLSAATDYKQQVRDVRKSVLRFAKAIKNCWGEREQKLYRELIKCRPAAPRARIKTLVGGRNKFTGLRHTCQFKCCPQCYYRKVKKVYQFLRDFQAPNYAATVAVFPVIGDRSEEKAVSLRKACKELAAGLRQRMLRNCKFRDGIRFAFFEPQDWVQTSGPTQFLFRLGFVAPVFDLGYRPKQVVLWPSRNANPTPITYSTNLEDLLASACHFEPRLIDPRTAADLDWIRRVTADLHEFQTYGKPKGEVEAVDASKIVG